VALVDALGNLVRFVMLPGQAHDLKGVPPLIDGLDFDALLADKAFDANWLLADLDDRAHCTTVVAEGGERWCSGGLFFTKRSVPWSSKPSPPSAERYARMSV